ncbi:DUF1845 family protein [Endozoicomonas sp. SM1973]|uniref:DUF1845 family protein n=1 Tax=Spartinivicinus marinus TaxID=2994442 RepID=A0A853IJH9_9GAMM|nr:AcaB family transcriptional regulator [Spartinivicinus marinus]MCX4030163.1 AcaB family transcriptional regulator [Spartinivicinus marinus]NYZ67806.1 DUF1845 family protein [Spartinivicinus marinus]
MSNLLVSEIAFQTYVSRALLTGKPANGETRKFSQIGLISFANSIKIIEKRVRSDQPDPYGIWCLVKTEQALKKNKVILSKFEQAVNEILDLMPDNLSFAIDKKRISKPDTLQFTSTYPIIAARQLAQFDLIMQKALVAKSFGLFNSNNHFRDMVHQGASGFRTLFTIPKHCPKPVTFDDLVLMNDKAKAAIKQGGVIPQEIIDGEIELEHSYISSKQYT